MARKNESTSEKIVRLYKEGCSVDEIARVMEIPKGNIPNILEKHFPDYQNYVQPEKRHDIEPEKPAKKGGIGGFFGRGKKEEPTADPQASMLNLDMDDEGFIDRSVAGIASMIKKGRSPKDICAFLNCSPADVTAVSLVMDEHFRRKEAAEAAKRESFRTGPDYDGPKVKESTDLLTGSSATEAVNTPPVSLSELEQEYVPPVYDPVPDNPTMDELIVPDVNELTFESDIPKTPTYAEPEAEAESADNFEIPSAAMPTIDEISAEPFTEQPAEEEAQTEAAPEAPADEQPADEPSPEQELINVLSGSTESASGAENDEEDTTDYNIEEDDSMTPMEKMRKFAELQIKDNEDKIAELEKKAEDAKASVDSVAAKVGEIEAQIAKLREEADQIAADKVKAEAEAAELESQIAALKKENDEFQSYIK